MNTTHKPDPRRQSMTRDRETILLFSAYIKNLREQKGWTQEETAERIGVTQVYYGYIESGARNVTLNLAMRICEVFGVKLKDFLDVYYK